MNLISLIEKFEGVIGALLGVGMTLILTTILKNAGKLHFYSLYSKITYKKKINELYGDMKTTENRFEAENTSVEMKIEIYNSNELPKILREVRMHGYKSGSELFNTTVDNQTTEKKNGVLYSRDEFININIPPKQIIDIHLIKYLNEEKTKLMSQCDKLQIEAKDPKGKNFVLATLIL